MEQVRNKKLPPREGGGTCDSLRWRLPRLQGKKKRIMSETVFHKNRAHYVALPIVVENLSASLSSSNLLLEFFGGFDERNCLTTTPVTYCCDTKDTMVRPSSMLTNNIKWIKKQKQKHI